MYERHWSDAEIQAARLDAARKVRDFVVQALRGTGYPGLATQMEANDDRVLARIISDTAAEGVMPNVSDNPVTRDLHGANVAVGREVSGGTVGVAPHESAALESPPRSSGEPAEPPRPYPETWATIDDAYRMGAQAERARAVGIIKELLLWADSDEDSWAQIELTRKAFNAAHVYVYLAEKDNP